MDVVAFMKVRRSETLDDIASARLKEKIGTLIYDNDGDDHEVDTGDSNDDQEENYKDDMYDGEADEGSEDAGDYRKHKQMRHVSHGYHQVEGKMKHGMEDYLVATRKEMDGKELGLYVIFDGHSGHEVAEYLQNHLLDSILDESDFWTNTKAAVKRAYDAINNHILENVVGSRGGSTGLAAILVDGDKLVVANVGDSRAVICRNGSEKQITIDHEPLKEKKKIESRGGFVSHNPGNVPRVDGQLAVARAFGDGKVKDHITSEPNVFFEKIEKDTESLILASDGLWKVVSNQDAVDCIRGLRDGKEAAEELIREALLRESKDDISCIVVMFHK